MSAKQHQRRLDSTPVAWRILLPMALRLLPVVVVVAAAAVARCRPALANPATGTVLPGLPVAGLAVGFYNESCPQVEDLVLTEMRAIVEKDWTLGPALLRFMFHDCLVKVRLLASVSCFNPFFPRSRCSFAFVSCVRVPSRARE